MWVAFIPMLTIALLSCKLSYHLSLPCFWDLEILVSTQESTPFRRRTVPCRQPSVKHMNSPWTEDEEETPQQGAVPNHPQPIHALTFRQRWSSTPLLKGTLKHLKRRQILIYPRHTATAKDEPRKRSGVQTCCVIWHFMHDILCSCRLLILLKHLFFHGLPWSYRL